MRALVTGVSDGIGGAICRQVANVQNSAVAMCVRERRLEVEAIADELACAAGLVCGKLTRTPACIIRGFEYKRAAGTARDLIRPAANDLFR